MTSVDKILELYDSRGHSEYGGEDVTQLEHALQSALLAEEEQAGPALITAALLHDVGHLLHELPDDAPEQGIDDRHEASAGHFLRKLFPEAVTEPVRLHVAAKRYLCAVDPGYLNELSEPSLVSLRLQGGPMTPDELKNFGATATVGRHREDS
jgi:predicted HD phosphohydrolase